jgi:S-adenosylmethionine:tRNA ribosyltransferase-isomerase
VSDAATGALEHRAFAEFPRLLAPGDLLVVNDSATLPAALDARLPDGTGLALHLSARVTNSLWIVEPRAGASEGEVLALPGAATATLLARVHPGERRLWYARVEAPDPVVEYLHRYGTAIRYAYVDRAFPIADYQTIFARVPGSAEMPSAGRPFSVKTLAGLRERGVAIATVTLHAGVSSAEAHEPPQPEPFSVPHATAEAVNATRRSGGRIVAVGTTVVRALESAVAAGVAVAANGWTDLVVTPERRLAVVDGILTGFHEPRASHLAMLRAFTAPGVLEAAYAAALDRGYLWHEFGDVHLIV